MNPLPLKCYECEKAHEYPYTNVLKGDEKIYFHSRECFYLYCEKHMEQTIKKLKKVEIENTENNFMSIMFEEKRETS